MREETPVDYERRIMIDKQMKDSLDEIKDRDYRIRTHQGHKDTLKKLIDHYHQTKELNEQIKKALELINATVEKSVFKSFRNFFSNLFRAAVREPTS